MERVELLRISSNFTKVSWELNLQEAHWECFLCVWTSLLFHWEWEKLIYTNKEVMCGIIKLYLDVLNTTSMIVVKLITHSHISSFYSSREVCGSECESFNPSSYWWFTLSRFIECKGMHATEKKKNKTYIQTTIIIMYVFLAPRCMQKSASELLICDWEWQHFRCC